MSDIFDGGGVGATAPSEFGGMLSQPPLSPALDRPAPPPLPTLTEPEPAPAPVAPEPEATPGMLERKLLQFGLVTMDQLGEAMREEAATGRSVSTILIERGWVTQEQITQLLEPAAALALEPVAAPPPAPEPEPAFVAEVPPAPAPEPALDPVPVAPPPEPAAEVAPEPAVAPLVVSSSLAFHLYIRLSTGERIDANTFTDLNDAKLHAEDLVKKLSTNSHVWPHFGGRYIRPEAIISIDVEAAPV